MDRSVGEALDSEITAFAATYRDLYAPRPGALVGAGPTPRLSELKTSYDALAYHFARYRRRGLAEPLRWQARCGAMPWRRKSESRKRKLRRRLRKAPGRRAEARLEVGTHNSSAMPKPAAHVHMHTP